MLTSTDGKQPCFHRFLLFRNPCLGKQQSIPAPEMCCCTSTNNHTDNVRCANRASVHAVCSYSGVFRDGKYLHP